MPKNILLAENRVFPQACFFVVVINDNRANNYKHIFMGFTHFFPPCALTAVPFKSDTLKAFPGTLSLPPLSVSLQTTY